MRKTSGVVQFVGNRQGAVPIQDKEINDVRTVLEERVSCSPYPFLQLGQRVRIRGGAFDGIEGVLVGRDSASKLVISIELIQRSLAVSVYNLDVEPVGGYISRPPDRTQWRPYNRDFRRTHSAVDCSPN